MNKLPQRKQGRPQNEKLEKEVIAYHKKGFKDREIASLVFVTRQRVQQIVSKYRKLNN